MTGAHVPEPDPQHGVAHTASGRPVDPADMSMGDTFAAITEDLSSLVRSEIELAKAEATESAKKAGIGVGMFGGAGVAANLALTFCSLALAYALGTLIGFGWGALVVGVIWAIVAGVLAMLGKKNISKVGMPETTDSVARIPGALKGEEAPR